MLPIMEDARVTEEGSGDWPGQAVAWLLLAAAYLGVALIRWRLLEVPLERDEGEYAYFGQLLLRGFPPYQLAYTMKLPGTQLAYAAAMAVFGQTAAGLRIGLLVVNAATTALLFLLGRRLLGTAAALAAAAAFAWLSISTALLGLFGHATHFVLLPAVAGLLVLHRAIGGGRLPAFFGSGLLLGAALLMKQPGGVFLLFGAGWLAWSRSGPGGAGRGRLVAEEGALLAGAAVPLFLVVAWAWLGGTLDQLWLWTVRYAQAYSTARSLGAGLEDLARNGSGAIGQAWLLAAVAGAGLIAVAWPGRPVRERAFLVALPACSFVGVSAGLYFRGHYFILLLPALGLLVGAAVRLAAERAGRAGAVAGLLVVAAGCGQTAWTQRDLLFRLTPAQVSRALYLDNPFPESPMVAEYIAARTGPEDRIAILGSEPQILFYARRLSATGFVYAYGLMEPQPFARAMQEQLASEVEQARPAYLVWAFVPTSWLVRRTSDPWIFQWADQFVARDYDLVGQVQILAPDRTDAYWDEAAARAPETRANRVLVFRRRDFTPGGSR